MKIELLNKLKKVKLFLFDLEGVLLNPGNSEDQLINLLNRVFTGMVLQNIHFGIISGRPRDELIKKLERINNCTVINSTLDKVTAADKLLADLNIGYDSVFFVGDDLLDLPLLKKCAISAAPASARREVKRSVNFIFKGESAEAIINELMTLFLKSKEAANRATRC